MSDIAGYSLLAAILVIGIVFWRFEQMVDEVRNGGGMKVVVLALAATVIIVLGGVWVLGVIVEFIFG